MSGCIEHPDGSDRRGWFQPLRWTYVEMCGGNACAALLLANLEHWTNLRRKQGKHEWVYRSRDELLHDLFGAFGYAAIDTALGLLVKRGFAERRNNPKSRRDRKYQYRLCTAAIQAEIDSISHSSIPEDGNWDFLDSNIGNPRSITEEPIEEPREDEGLRGEVGEGLPSSTAESWEKPFEEQGLPPVGGV